jgi:hypothetical protein
VLRYSVYMSGKGSVTYEREGDDREVLEGTRDARRGLPATDGGNGTLWATRLGVVTYSYGWVPVDVPEMKA